MVLAPYIDHTNLKPDATVKDIEQLCKEAIAQNFKAVCVNGCHIPSAVSLLHASEVKIATVIGFPLGAMSTEAKLFETEDAIAKGVDEVDMVLNIGWLKSQMDEHVQKEILQIKNAIGQKVLKVILETCYLTDQEKQRACRLAVAAGADFVKTSTGFGPGGATFDDVQLMKTVVGDKAQIKASGGIRDRETALKYIELGVTRIGTSSGPKLIKN